MYADKLQGAIRFHAIGDALGTPHELRGRVPYEQYDGTIKFNVRHQSQYQGLRVGTIGQVSDDTEMSLSLARSILSNRGYNPQSVVKAYMDWANSGSIFIGINTRELFKGVTTVNGFTKRWTDKFQPLLQQAETTVTLTLPDSDRTIIIPFNSKISQSNGTLMRIIPLLTLFRNNSIVGWQAAIADVWLTNPNPINLECSLLYLQMGRMILNGIMVTDIINYLTTNVVQLPIRQVIQDVVNNTPRNIDTREKGWVIIAFYCAVWAVYRLDREPARSILDQIIRMRGDADTNAAIAGGLIGLWHGWKQLSLDPVIHTNWNIIVNADLSKGDFVRPDLYHPSNYPDIMNQLLE